ncbi:DUF6216 family protein [Rahnella woolbedingensis]|uniref:Uncharacterized protein n=1 Tax=Rahnella woolbedingensis TaxID=1510574 RepID=A0A419N693_9GAMM|nr:DUF6216 family protein [Rahnella woolbedingensis]RJT42287.1 hypothetical protein D6C13_16990 [Rahnella woolbedingensis]
MDFDTIISFILKYDSLLNSLVLISACLAVLFYIQQRAGSSYSILNRLWSFMLGGKEFHSHSLTRFLRKRNDIEHFNMLFNMKAKSIDEINEFIKWMDVNNIDIKQVSQAKNWFDISALTVKRPRGWTSLCMFITMAVTFYLLLLSLTIALKPAALLKINEGEPWIWVGKEKISNYAPNISFSSHSWHDWYLDEEKCAVVNFDYKNFSSFSHLRVETIKKVCESFQKPKDQKYIAKIIKGQNVFFFIALYPGVIFIISIITLMRRYNALSLLREVERLNN